MACMGFLFDVFLSPRFHMVIKWKLDENRYCHNPKFNLVLAQNPDESKTIPAVKHVIGFSEYDAEAKG